MSFAITRDVHAPHSTFWSVGGNVTTIHANGNPLDWPHKTFASDALYDSASCSSSPCFPGTRSEILSLISHWVANPNGRRLYWLCGHTGSGKSAIAQTISRHCDNAGQLAAAFFCSRGNAGHGKMLVSTIAYQLTKSLPSLDGFIRNKIAEDPHIFERTIAVQFQRLIVDPVTQNSGSIQRLVVIIDGLDECDDRSAREIAPLVSDAVKNRNFPLQFLVTSRPVSHIERPFARNNSIMNSFTLRNFGVRDDIRLFLTTCFREIYEDHPAMRDVAPPWPSHSQIERLVEMSDLFIFASSVIRFIDDTSNSPDDQLKVVLGDKPWSLPAEDELSKMYHQILSTSRFKKCDTEHLRLILGTIVCLQKPLPLPAIAILQPRISIGRLRALLDPLRSVLVVPDEEEEKEGKVVTTFHQSFPDFLTDKSCSARDYWIDSSVFAASLTNSCLDLLSKSESPELPCVGPTGVALEYAHRHYLGLLQRGIVVDHFLEFSRFAFFHAAVLILSTFFDAVRGSATEIYVVRCITAAFWTFLLLILVSFTVFTNPFAHRSYYDYCLSASVVSTVVCTKQSATKCAGKILTCLSLETICQMENPIDDIVEQIVSGVAFDTIIRNVFGLDSGVACAVPSSNWSAWVIRLVTSAVMLDAVTQIMVTVAQHKKFPPFWPTVGVIWMAGSAVGRIIGAAVVASGTLQIISIIIIGFASSAAMLVVFLNSKPASDHYFIIFAHQHLCRWIKARYHLAVEQRKIPIGFTAPLRYIFLIVEFYLRLFKPSHVSMGISTGTRQEQLYCDWCTKTDMEETSLIPKWISRTANIP